MAKKKSGTVKKTKPKKTKKSKKEEPSQTGCTSANIHEGARSEYLAHYVFSSFGTSVPVPRQEDTGLDLICTLAEREGQRLWPIASYCVQVKSTDDPWLFSGSRSVKALVEYPLPIFFCVVNKKSAKISIFNTWPRFLAWVESDTIQRLEMVPGVNGEGSLELGTTPDNVYSLSAPIAEFSVMDILDDEFHASMHQVLRTWILNDDSNIRRIQAGIKGLKSIWKYKTNDATVLGEGWVSRPMISDLKNDPQFAHFIEHLKWVAYSLGQQGDFDGFLRAAILLRHFNALHPVIDELGCYPVLQQLKVNFPSTTSRPNELAFSGLDGLNEAVTRITGESIQKARQQHKIDSASLKGGIPDLSYGKEA